MSKKKKSAASSAALNISIKLAAILLTFILMAVMILNAPIIAYHETNGSMTTVENLSITNYMKQ